MNKKIQSILLEKVKSSELAHLYIIESNQSDFQDYCLNWTMELFKQISTKIHPENNPDILFLSTEKDNKQYTIEHIKEIHAFTNYKATILSQKYLIINEAHKLTENSYNKLLKTFEEPPIELTVFLLNPHKVKLIATIESRAIKIKILNKEDKKINYLHSLMNSEISFTEFCEKLDKNKSSLQETLSELIELYSESKIDITSLCQLKEDILLFEQDLLYNNSAHSMRLRIFDSFIKLN